MIRSVTVTILFAFIAKAHVSESPLNRADVDATTLFKMGDMKLPTFGKEETAVVEKKEEVPSCCSGKTSKKGAWPPKITVRGALDSPYVWPPKPDPSIGSTWETTFKDVHCQLKSMDFWPSQRTQSVSFDKKIGAVCCTLDSPGVWPPKPSVAIKGTLKKYDTSVCYNLKTPVPQSWPLEPAAVTGSVSLEKTVAGATAALKTKPVWPPKPVATIKKTVKSKAGSICFGLESPADWPAKPTATISSTLNTVAGTIGSTLESKIDSFNSPPKVTGSISLKKNVGKVCCVLETKTSGSIRCSFESAIPGTKAVAESSPDVISPLVGALFGLLASSGFIFAMLRSRRGASSAGKVPLLPA